MHARAGRPPGFWILPVVGCVATFLVTFPVQCDVGVNSAPSVQHATLVETCDNALGFATTFSEAAATLATLVAGAAVYALAALYRNA